MESRKALIFLVFLYLLMALINLGGYDLWPPDEPRFAQVAREMMLSGDYIAPHINGNPYHEKPPLLFWTTVLFSLPFGDVTEWSARLPSVLGGLITLVLTYLLASRMFGARLAFWAALILITTQRFWWQSRFGQIDMLLTGCVTASFYFFWCWHKDRKQVYLIAWYLAMAAGALAKGPPAFVFPLLTALVFYWKQKGELKKLHLISGLLGAAFLVCLWMVPARMAISGGEVSGAQEEIATNLFRQTIGRFFMGVNHINWPWYYAIQTPIDLLPWALFLPLVLPWLWRHRKDSEELRFLFSWTLPAFIFFSISLGKRSIYLLPLWPAFAIMLAVGVEQVSGAEYLRWRKWIGMAWGVLLLLLGVAPFAIPFTKYADLWTPWLMLVSAIACVAGLAVLYDVFKKATAHLPHHVAAGFSALSVAIALVVLPLVDEHKSAKDFCEPLRSLSEAGTEYELYSLGFSKEEYVFYAKHFHKVIPDDLALAEGAESMDMLEKLKALSDMLEVIRDAVETVEIKAMDKVTEQELSALREAVEKCIVEHSKDEGEFLQKEEEMRSTLLEFFNLMDVSGPVFVIVQDRDWRWVLALSEKANLLPVIKMEAVGSREVLLIGNEKAKGLLK